MATFRKPATLIPSMLALMLALGWAAREAAIAGESRAELASKTIPLDEIKMETYKNGDEAVGTIGIYLAGDTPASKDFVTGRLTLDAAKSPHPPHVHAEEEVMIVETGHGEIVNDGKTTKVGPGSVMFTTPNVPHGIVNTGDVPLTFYFIKWAPKTGR
jgi:mannose-6-phosphate isomerase-like protein (cupin superfamily)